MTSPQRTDIPMDPVFANQLEACDYYNIDIMTQNLTAEEKEAVEAMAGGAAIDSQEDAQREDNYEIPATRVTLRERSLSPERYVTPTREHRTVSTRAVASAHEERREARLRNAAARAMEIAGIPNRANRANRRELFPDPREEQEVVRDPDTTVGARAPGPLTLPRPAVPVPPVLPARTTMQTRAAPHLIRHNVPYNDAVLHNVDISTLIAPYVIQLERDPRDIPTGIPEEHAVAWRKLVQIGIMISHYSQLIMTDCEVYIALEQVSRILTAYNGHGVRQLFRYLRGRDDIRATHLYDLHNGYKRFFIAAAAQLNEAHVSPAARVSSGARVFTQQQ